MAEAVRRLKINRRYESAACAWCTDALALGEDGAICEACEAPHHARCWDKENGCNGDSLCVNRPLQQISDWQLAPGERKRRSLRPGESLCQSCGDIVTTGACFRCKTMADGGEFTGYRDTSTAAKNALWMAVIGLFCFGIILGPIAFIKAMEAKRRIEDDPTLDGAGLATVAQVLGVLEFLLSILYIFR